MRRTTDRTRLTIYKILCQDPRLFVQVCLSHVIIGNLRFFRSLLYRTVLLLCPAQLFIYLMQMGKLHLQSVQILDSLLHFIPLCRQLRFLFACILQGSQFLFLCLKGDLQRFQFLAFIFEIPLIIRRFSAYLCNFADQFIQSFVLQDLSF